MLQDFAIRYWDNTHPVEKVQWGVEAGTELILNILLLIFTAGTGTAANIAAKSGRLVNLAKLLEKVASVLKRVRSHTRLPKLRKKGTGGGAKLKARTQFEAKGPDQPKTPKKSKAVDGKDKNSYGNDTIGPKETPKGNQIKPPIKWDQEEQYFIDADGKKYNSSEMPEGFGKPSTWKTGQKDVTEEVIAARNGSEFSEKMKNSAEADDLQSAIEAVIKGLKK